MSTYLESIAPLSDDDLRAEVRKHLVQLHTLRGRERTNAYGRLLDLDQFLQACGKGHLYAEAVAADVDEQARLRASNAAGRAIK